MTRRRLLVLIAAAALVTGAVAAFVPAFAAGSWTPGPASSGGGAVVGAPSPAHERMIPPSPTPTRPPGRPGPISKPSPATEGPSGATPGTAAPAATPASPPAGTAIVELTGEQPAADGALATPSPGATPRWPGDGAAASGAAPADARPLPGSTTGHGQVPRPAVPSAPVPPTADEPTTARPGALARTPVPRLTATPPPARTPVPLSLPRPTWDQERPTPSLEAEDIACGVGPIDVRDTAPARTPPAEAPVLDELVPVAPGIQHEAFGSVGLGQPVEATWLGQSGVDRESALPAVNLTGADTRLRVP